MKKKLFSAVVAVAMIAALASVAVAQTGIPGSGWWTGEQVQNVGPATANIVVTAYDKASAATFTASQSVAAGAAFTFIPTNFAGMPSGFQKRASSSKPRCHRNETISLRSSFFQCIIV